MDTADRLGERAWDEFYTQRVRLYGATDGRGKSFFTSDPNKHHRFYKAFRSIGEMCDTRGIDVADYITTCFSLVSKNHNYITPKDFARVEAVEAYLKHKKTYGDSSQAAWTSQARDLTDIVSRCIPSLYANIEEVVMDPRQPFTAWFRMLYQKTFSEKMAELYGQSAWSELRADKRLRIFLRRFRPDGMRELEKLIGYFGDVEPEATHV